MSPASRPARRRLELMRLNEIEPARRNPKGHDAPGISRSIDRFGYVEVITLDERTGRLLAGHGRLTDLEAKMTAGAAPPDGIELDDDGHWLVPVLRGVASRNDAEADAYLIAANQLTILGGWEDEAQLAEMLSDLANQDLLDVTGFRPVDLDELLDRVAAAQPPAPTLNEPDDTPPLPAKAHTKTGQLWQLGPHVLLVGDARSAGRIVLDPYAGAGTTAIAAHAVGMHARLIEKDARYADVICRRYQEHTGTKPVGPNGKAHDFTDG